MTRKNTEEGIGHTVLSGTGSGILYPRMVSVLLIFSNPSDLDWLCHHLEKNANIIVDIRVSDEDAVHLMHYVPFDVIVTEYPATRPDRISFLKMIRSRSISTPVIYYSRLPDGIPEDDARQYDPVYFVARNTSRTASEPDDLYSAIMRIVSENPAPAP